MASEDRYQIVRELGRGNKAIVYLATDSWLKREVALKTFKPPDDTLEWRDALRRLVREAQVAGNLDHPHIVPVYDIIPEGRLPSIVMKYVRGKTLAEAVPLGVRANPPFALRILKECAGALDYAYSCLRVHRDFKPGNVMIDEYERAFVMDFGIARLLDSPMDSMAGRIMGNFEFMSPEQMNAAPVDGRSDQYSLAVVAYQLLTGCRVFDALNLSALVEMVPRDPPPPPRQRNPSLPRGVDDVLLRSLAKKAEDRYASCTAFVIELEAALRDSGPSQPGPDAFATIRKPVKIGPKAGDVRVNEIDGQTYRWIPAGTFQMGCSPGDEECYDDEKPAHAATVSKGFWMGETPVTEGAYKRYAEATGTSIPVAAQMVLGQRPAGNDLLPVVSVNWDEAASYCKWAGGRFPTEAEWEYAARAGATGARYGNLDDIAWCKSNSGGPPPVRLKRPNGFGLFDMLGNVWEWTADWYGPEYYQVSGRLDPQGPPNGTARTLRGGSWYDYAQSTRASCRSRLGPGYRYDLIGFRCVLV